MVDYYALSIDELLSDLIARDEDYFLTITPIDEERIPENLVLYNKDEDLLEHADMIYINNVPEWFECGFEMEVADDVYED